MIVIMTTILLVFAVLGAVTACGRSADIATVSTAHPGTTKAVRWEVAVNHGRRLVIGAFVPFCGEKSSRPYVATVRRQAKGRLTLTMRVHFPPRHGSCVGYDLGVRSVVRLNKKQQLLPVYDGATHPPELRIRR